jgi:localization factor PodJL
VSRVLAALAVLTALACALAVTVLLGRAPAHVPAVPSSPAPRSSAPDAPHAGPAPGTPAVTAPVVRGIQPGLLQRYRAEAAAGDAAAQNDLAVCLEQGLGVPADPSAAATWYRASAAQGFAPAQFHLGECYEHGTGVPRDLEQARAWYQRAAGHGLGQARTALDRLGPG